MTFMQKFKKDFLERYDVQIEQFKTVLGHLAMYIGEKPALKRISSSVGSNLKIQNLEPSEPRTY